MSESVCAATPTPLWRGWFRPHRRAPWVVVASGDHEQVVHDQMLHNVNASGDFMLCEGSKDPNETKV